MSKALDSYGKHVKRVGRIALRLGRIDFLLKRENSAKEKNEARITELKDEQEMRASEATFLRKKCVRVFNSQPAITDEEGVLTQSDYAEKAEQFGFDAATMETLPAEETE